MAGSGSASSTGSARGPGAGAAFVGGDGASSGARTAGPGSRSGPRIGTLGGGSSSVGVGLLGATGGGPEARRDRAIRIRAANRTTTTTPMAMNSAVMWAR